MAIKVDLLTADGRLYNPLPAQRNFHLCRAPFRAYIAGYGAGKTQAGAIEAILQTLEIKDGRGGVGVICRYEWQELVRTTWKVFIDSIPPPVRSLCVIRQAPTPSCIFPNGFEVLGYNLKRLETIRSLNISWGWIDEAAELGVEESSYLELVGRRRNRLGTRQIWLTGNPAGRGHWIYKRFYAHLEDPGARKYKDHEGFHATTYENKYLPEDYKRAMEETYPAEWLKRFYEGSWDLFIGQVLTEFEPTIHVVPPFEIPDAWPRYRGVDHGITHPACCLWCAVDPDGNLIFYREHWKKNLTPEANAEMILQASKKEEGLIRWTVIDPATRAKETAGGVMEAIIEQYRRGGLFCHPGDNDVAGSISRLKSLLSPDDNRLFPKYSPRAGNIGSPRMFITADCKTFRWELENWKWRDVKPGRQDREQVVNKDDDLIACARYIVMRRPGAAEQAEPITDSARFQQLLAELRGKRREDEEFTIGLDRLGESEVRRSRHWDQSVPVPLEES